MEAGSGPTGSPTGARSTHVVGRVARRLTTETKQAFKTTEFWLTALVIAGILVAALLIDGGDTDGTDEFIASQAWLYVAIVVVGYNIGRGAAKSGSYDSYTEDGDSRH